VRQSLDYSCGAAALATVLTHYYGKPVTERSLLDELLGGRKERSLASPESASGLSFDDLATLARGRGFLGLGASVSFADLERLRHPVIVALDLDGREHFSVLRRAGAHSVALADPSWGNREMLTETFKKHFLNDAAGSRGRILVILDRTGEQADSAFMNAQGADALLAPGLLQRPH
jgi:predicted double-glycine peptidase